MKTIKECVIKTMTDNNASYLASTTCYNYYRTTLDSKQANVNKLALSLFLKDDDLACLCVVVGKKGWSQHSATDLHLFDVKNVTGLIEWPTTNGQSFFIIHRSKFGV